MNRVRKILGYGRYVSIPFGGMAIVGAVDERIRRLTGRPYTRWVYARKDEMFQRFLYDRFGSFIDEWKYRQECAVPYADVNSAPIWVLWIQGEGSLPALVHENLEALRHYAGNHPVHLVSMESLPDFAELPGRYMDLLGSGQITAAAFSDIVRIYLLQQHGGLWVDSSVRITKSLPREIFDLPLWTAKGIDGEFPWEPRCIDITEWTGYFLAAPPNSLFFSFLKAAYDVYFDEYDEVLDYLLINHFAKIAREQIGVIGDEHALIPDNNYYCEILRDALDAGDLSLARKCLESTTYMFKLTIRAEWARPGEDGRTQASRVIESILGRCE